MVTIIGSSAALRKKKNLKKSVNFTVMVIGESGSGRSTFINSFCDQLIVPPSSTINQKPLDYDPSKDDESYLELRKSVVELEDNEGVKINLNIIDTPGFGSSLDSSSTFQIIKDFLKSQFDEILVEESRLRRNPRFKDGRVHACLYFITPTGHGLKESDVTIIKELGNLVNIIPVIGKADSLTLQELQFNKKLIREDIEHYKLPLFDFTDEYFSLDDYYDAGAADDQEDETTELNRYLQNTVPFAVMGSNTVIKDEATGELKRVRKYPWGIVDIFDNDISDFLTLKNTLLITHLNDLKDYTHEVLYENYRVKTLGDEEEEEPVDTNISGEGFASGTSQRVISLSQKPSSPVIGRITSDRMAGSPKMNVSEKEEQIRLEEERLRAFEERVQRDLMKKREEIEARERELAEIERRLKQQGLVE